MFAEYLAGDEDREPVKWSAIAAIVVHFIIFALVISDAIQEPIALDARMAATIVKRYKPPAPPAQAKKTRRKRRASVLPIPDPTPEEPEPIEFEESDFTDFGEFDAQFAIGLPDGAPGLSGVGGTARDGAFRAGEGGVVPPVVVVQIDPEYTPEATRRGIQGQVWIEAVVDIDGRVIEPRLLRGLPDDELNQRAIAAIQRWVFRPGMKDGETVPVIAVFTVTYRLH